jgi:hypothetical protein
MKLTTRFLSHATLLPVVLLFVSAHAAEDAQKKEDELFAREMVWERCTNPCLTKHAWTIIGFALEKGSLEFFKYHEKMGDNKSNYLYEHDDSDEGFTLYDHTSSGPEINNYINADNFFVCDSLFCLDTPDPEMKSRLGQLKGVVVGNFGDSPNAKKNSALTLKNAFLRATIISKQLTCLSVLLL